MSVTAVRHNSCYDIAPDGGSELRCTEREGVGRVVLLDLERSRARAVRLEGTGFVNRGVSLTKLVVDKGFNQTCGIELNTNILGVVEGVGTLVNLER